MDVFVLIISRLVPMLLVASATLVLARVAYDVAARHDRRAALGVFAVIGALGVALLVPWIIRLDLMVAAARANRRGDWPTVDAALSELRQRGGHEDASMTKDWIAAALNLGANAKAEALIREHLRPKSGRTVVAEPQEILMLGVARYRAGRLAEAQRTLAAVPDAKTTDVFLRDYYLGRIAERRGDCAAAMARFDAALRAQPTFYPAQHHRIHCPDSREFHVVFIQN